MLFRGAYELTAGVTRGVWNLAKSGGVGRVALGTGIGGIYGAAQGGANDTATFRNAMLYGAAGGAAAFLGTTRGGLGLIGEFARGTGRMVGGAVLPKIRMRTASAIAQGTDLQKTRMFVAPGWFTKSAAFALSHPEFTIGSAAILGGAYGISRMNRSSRINRQFMDSATGLPQGLHDRRHS